MNKNFGKEIASMKHKPTWKADMKSNTDEFAVTIGDKTRAGSGDITFYKQSFTSSKRLYLVADHELGHASHFSSGQYAKWYGAGGSTFAENMSEMYAWQRSMGTANRINYQWGKDVSSQKYLEHYDILYPGK